MNNLIFDADLRLLDYIFQAQNQNTKPRLNLSLSLPSFSRSISPINQPDGTVISNKFSNLSSTARLSFSKAFPNIGSNLGISTNIRRYDNLLGGTFTEYSSNILSVSWTFNFFESKKYRLRTLLDDSRHKLDSLNQTGDYQKYITKIYGTMLNLKIRKNEFNRMLIKRTNLNSLEKNIKELVDLKRILPQNHSDLLLLLKEVNLTLENLNSYIILDSERLDDLDFSKNFNSNSDSYYWSSLSEYSIIPIEEILEFYQINNQSLYEEYDKNIENLELEELRTTPFSLSLNSGLGLSNSSDNIKDLYLDPFKSQSISIGLNRTFDFGIKRNQRRIKKQEHEISKRNNVLLRMENIHRIKGAYLRLCHLQKLQILYRKNIDFELKEIDRLEKLLIIGRVSFNDIYKRYEILFNKESKLDNIISNFFKELSEIKVMCNCEILDNRNGN